MEINKQKSINGKNVCWRWQIVVDRDDDNARNRTIFTLKVVKMQEQWEGLRTREQRVVLKIIDADNGTVEATNYANRVNWIYTMLLMIIIKNSVTSVCMLVFITFAQSVINTNLHWRYINATIDLQCIEANLCSI